MKRIEPKAGQESVWDYPRPPKLEPSTQRVRVLLDGHEIAASSRAFRVLETSHPPNWYIPREDVRTEYLTATPKRSHCEWKGGASYWTVSVGEKKFENAAWSYANPNPRFAEIKDYLAFYPSQFECYVGDERVQAQEGGFYGGWITSDVVGPFKGGAGSWGW